MYFPIFFKKLLTKIKYVFQENQLKNFVSSIHSSIYSDMILGNIIFSLINYFSRIFYIKMNFTVCKNANLSQYALLAIINKYIYFISIYKIINSTIRLYNKNIISNGDMLWESFPVLKKVVQSNKLIYKF